MTRIYLDHAATTPMLPEAKEAMLPFLGDDFGNASALYLEGRRAKKALDEAREVVAAAIAAQPREIVFTGGGSEADNLAVKGVALANMDKGRRVITSSIEHHAVLDAFGFLEDIGFQVTYLEVDGDGMVDPAAAREAISDETILISVMHANNEIGTIQPVEEIGEIARERGVYFHIDAVQTAGALPLDVDRLQCDLLTLSAHKFYGPKGVGALYVREGTRITALVHGGGHERGRRAGTENVAGIVGMAKALSVVTEDLDSVPAKIAELRDELVHEVEESMDGVRLNGHRTQRLPNNVHLSFAGVSGQALVRELDAEGIAASSASACSSGSTKASHVLLSMGLSEEEALGALRLTLGRDNEPTDVARLLQVLPRAVAKLREEALVGR